MAPDKTTATDDRGSARTTPVFSPARANRALVLVRRIVADMVKRYDRLMELRRERDEMLSAGAVITRSAHLPAARHERLEELEDGIARYVEQLSDLNHELLSTGCVLKDWRTGLVDFPASYGGRRVWLCWRLDEPAVTHWHEWHAGIAGRLPITDDFN